MRISDWSSDVCSSDLSERYDASFEQIAHRLVTLRRAGEAGVPFGFLRADPAGRLSKHFPLPGLLLPNSGHACPLWTIYAAFRAPGQVIRQVARFSDGSRFLFVAKAAPRRSSGFAAPTPPHSISAARRVGTKWVRSVRLRWSPTN